MGREGLDVAHRNSRGGRGFERRFVDSVILAVETARAAGGYGNLADFAADGQFGTAAKVEHALRAVVDDLPVGAAGQVCTQQGRGDRCIDFAAAFGVDDYPFAGRQFEVVDLAAAREVYYEPP